MFQLDGYRALNSQCRALAPTLEKLEKDLHSLPHVTPTNIQSMGQVERTSLAKEIKRIVGCIQRVHDALAHEIKLLNQVNVNRLRQWAADERSPVSFHFEHKDGTLSICGTKDFIGLPIPEELRTSYLPSLDAAFGSRN